MIHERLFEGLRDFPLVGEDVSFNSFRSWVLSLDLWHICVKPWLNLVKFLIIISYGSIWLG